MTEETTDYQALRSAMPLTRRVMRHFEYSRARDHVVLTQGEGEHRSQICLSRDQAELLLRWMIDDLFPDAPDPDDGEPVHSDEGPPVALMLRRRA